MYRCAVATVFLLGCSAVPATYSKADTEAQTKRAALIEQLKAAGWVDRIETNPNRTATAWITTAFLEQDFEVKVNAADLLFSWAFEVDPNVGRSMPNGWLLIFRSTRSGEIVGQYHPYNGLRLD